jgi:thioredoxin 1
MTIAIAISFLMAAACLWGAFRLIRAAVRLKKSRSWIGGIALAFLGTGLVSCNAYWIGKKPTAASKGSGISQTLQGWMSRLRQKPPESEGRRGSMVPKAPDMLPLDRFDHFTQGRGRLMVLEFGAEWSGPCVRFAPTLEKIHGEFDDVATVARLNIDSARQLARDQDVNEVPDLRFYRDGVMVGQLIGDVSEETLRKKFTDLTRELRAAPNAPPETAEKSTHGGPATFQRMKKGWLPSGVKPR